MPEKKLQENQRQSVTVSIPRVSLFLGNTSWWYIQWMSIRKLEGHKHMKRLIS